LKRIVLVVMLCALWARAGVPFSLSDSSRTVSYHDSFWAKDKAQHAVGSFFLTGLGIQSMKRLGLSDSKARIWSVSVTLSIGLGKEIRDSRQKNNIFSVPDLIADVLGIGLALWVVR